MAKHHLYDESPIIAHSEEGGTKVMKTKKKDEGDGPVEKGVKAEGFKESGMPHFVRHSMDRHNMHAKHETEHSLHDSHNKESKKDMHERHEKEMKDMHTRHEKEAGATGGSTDGEPITKIEKGMKKE